MHLVKRISYKIPLLLITLLLAGSAGCSKKNTAEQNRGNLNPILTFGNDGEAILSNPVVLATDRQEHLFVSDQLVSKIFHYDINGDFVKTIGREGRGPGEFTHQREIEVYNDRLFVQDMGLLRFHIFDFNGEVIDLRADTSAKYSSFTVNDSLIIGHIPDHPLKQEGLEQDSLIIIHDYDGNTIGEFGSFMNVTEGIPAIMSWPAITIYKDQVHVAFKYFPIYHIYDLHGTLISETKLNEMSGIEDPAGNHDNSSYKIYPNPMQI